MDVGIGLPAAVADISGRGLLAWAKRSEDSGFHSLAALDRLAYHNWEPLVALTAAAAVTTGIHLAATALIAPYRGNAALLAKQLATLDRLSSGRLVVGMAAGGRADDFRLSDMPYARRGARLDRTVEEMLRLWGGDELGPAPAAAPPLLFGGHTDMAIRRAARYGQGWISGGSSASGFGRLAERVAKIWADEGREDRPRLVALCYFALGSDARAAATTYLSGYYAFLGEQTSARIAKGALVDADQVAEAVARYTEAGCDELMFVPCASGIEQVDLLAAASFDH
jgi:alkanesulfonate monooxygenase SsuD/methylene tetrahydromethanopterin reductase-like flavin-dependent oxidoreductase (luciferase family)